MDVAFDPYEELGLARDASTMDVRRAYRRKAKDAHPDRGGKADDFNRIRRAMTVLTDPARRERFDSTGAADDGPDNTRSTALQVIEKHISGLVNGYLSGHGGDPRQMDVIGHLKRCINDELRDGDVQIENGRRIIAFLKDMGKRMTTDGQDDPLGRSIAAHIQHAEGQKLAVTEGLKARVLALKIVNHYSFRWDQPPAGQAQPYVPQGFTFSVRVG